jgi:hypothetical protein
MKTYEGMEVPPFLTSALDGNEWSASHLSHPKENGPQYPLDMRLGEYHNSYGHCGEEKNFLLLPPIELQPFSPQPVTIMTQLSQLQNYYVHRDFFLLTS